MGVITQAVMVQAAIDVNGMGQAQKVRLADEIFAQQPNLLASILALPRMGVGMVELEVPLHILLDGKTFFVDAVAEFVRQGVAA